MDIKKFKSKDVLSYCLISVVFFLWAYYFSYRSQWLNDDIIYRFHFGTDEPISSLYDVFTSQVVHYFTINGRMIAHILVQISIALFGRTVFSILNGFVFVLFISLIMKFIGVHSYKWKNYLFVALLVVLGFQTKFVPTCQIGYIWMFTIVLGFLLLFFNYADKKRTFVVNAFLLICSFLAGWTNEAIVVGVGFALLIYVYRNRKDLYTMQWLMFLIFGIGALLLCFSPATMARGGSEKAVVDFLSPGLYSMAKLVFYSRCSYLLLLYICFLVFYRKIPLKQIYRNDSFIINVYATLLVMNLVIGVFGNRQLFGMELCSIILIVRYINRYDDCKILKLGTSFLIIFFVYKTAFNVAFLERIDYLYDNILKEYEKSKDGVVFYDFDGRDVIFNETYPSSVFTSHVVKAINKDLQSRNKNYANPLTILPKVCEKLDQDHKKNNYYLKNGKDAFSIVLLKGNMPSNVIEQRVVRIGRLEIPFVDRNLNGLAPVYENEEYMVFQIYDKIPFIKGNNVLFQE